jgi:hypothetical protein
MTMITDYLITILVVVLAILMLPTDGASLFVVLSFFLTGIGAFLGGTSHGFKIPLGPDWNDRIWKVTTYTIGLAAFLLFLGLLLSSLPSSFIRSLFITVGSLQILVYIWWMWSHTEFRYVIINYATFMILGLFFKVYSLVQFGDPSSIWIISGILVTFLASGIQASGFTLHKHFNHNDLFHVVQLPGFFLVYLGTLLF